MRLTVACDARCVRPTSASHHSVDEYPRLVGSRSAPGITRSLPEKRTLHGAPSASAGLTPCFDAGRFLPRAEAFGRTSDTPSLDRALTSRDALFLRRTISLSASLDRLFHLPRDGRTAPSIRGAFRRPVSEPSARCTALSCRPRAMTRLSPIPRFCTPRPGSRRPFACDGLRFSLSRSTKTHRSLDPAHVNWPFG